MSELTKPTGNRDEPFETVLARARLKARGQEITPEAIERMKSRPTGSRADREAQVPDIHEFAQRLVQQSRAGMSGRPAPKPEVAKIQKSAAEVRMEWYIPPKHFGDTFANFRPQNESQRAALEASRAWADAVVSGHSPALALTGSVGTGKSHLMYAAIRHLNERDVNAGAWGWYDLANILREAKFDRDPEAYTEAKRQRDRLFGVRVIGIDEIRPTSGTEFDGTELSQLMTRAYRECQAVIVTSNFADRKLAEIIGLAAADRLTQVQLIGDSYRHNHLRLVPADRPDLERSGFR